MFQYYALPLSYHHGIQKLRNQSQFFGINRTVEVGLCTELLNNIGLINI